MKITHHEKHNGYLAVSISGEMDSRQCMQIQPSVEDIVKQAENCMVNLNMSRVTFLDSSGIGLIVFLFKRLKAIGGDLTLTSVNGQPLELIELLRIDKALSVNKELEDLQKLAS